MFSLEQQKKFNKKGIHHRKVSFAGNSKKILYDTALDFFISNRIILCRDDEQLKGELKSITIDYSKSPPKIKKSENSEYPNDDLVDCLCGVIQSISMGRSGTTMLPKPALVRSRIR